MTKVPPYEAEQLRRMSGELAILHQSVLEQIAWITEALKDRSDTPEHAIPDASRSGKADAPIETSDATFVQERSRYEQQLSEMTHRSELAEKKHDELLMQLNDAVAERDKAKMALADERRRVAEQERQFADLNARSERAERERDGLAAKIGALEKERDEIAVTLLTGERDPETGHPVTWKEKADQWNFAFIATRRRAERAESERDALVCRIKEFEDADAKTAGAQTPEQQRRQWLPQAS
jgi:chromosome segregation ATPase